MSRNSISEPPITDKMAKIGEKAFLAPGALECLMDKTQIRDFSKLARHLNLRETTLRKFATGGLLNLSDCFQVEILTENSVDLFSDDPFVGISEIYDSEEKGQFNYRLLDSLTSELVLEPNGTVVLALSLNETGLTSILGQMANRSHAIDSEERASYTHYRRRERRFVLTLLDQYYKEQVQNEERFYVLPELCQGRMLDEKPLKQLDDFFRKGLWRLQGLPGGGRGFLSSYRSLKARDLRETVDSLFQALSENRLNLLVSHDWYFSRLLDEKSDIPLTLMSVLRHRYLFFLAPSNIKRLKVHVNPIGDMSLDRRKFETVFGCSRTPYLRLVK